AVMAYPERVRGCVAGRLNGADFALWLPAPGVAAETAHALAEALRASLPAFGSGIQVVRPTWPSAPHPAGPRQAQLA
ncbi:hypothetical protein ACVBEH_32575, partial [Roseateles sp. GG27B]